MKGIGSFLTRKILVQRTGLSDINCSNASRIVVYPEIGMVYNRIKKSGNSSVLLLMYELLRDAGAALADRSDDYATDKGAAVRAGMALADLSRSQARRIAHYYWFTVVRNPYSRCLSMFLNKVAPGRNVHYAECDGYGEPTPEGFLKFISFLEHGGTSHNAHFSTQTGLLFRPATSFSYVARLESYRNDMLSILTANQLTPPPGYEFGQAHGSEIRHPQKVTGASAKLGLYFDRDIYRRVYNIYKDDFVAFGYERIEDA